MRKIPRNSLFVIILPCAIVAGIIALAWWLWVGTIQVTAQAAMENACAEFGEFISFDMTMQIYSRDGTLRKRLEGEIDASGIHYRAFRENVLADEFIITISTPTPPPLGARSRSVEPASELVTFTFFENESPGDDSQPDTWSHQIVESEVDENAFQDDVAKFCGHPIDDFSNLRYVGEERINGVLTRHYSGNVEVDGDPDNISNGDQQWDFWIDSNSRPVRVKEINRYNGVSYVTTISQWGERNPITAPVNPGTPPLPP